MGGEWFSKTSKARLEGGRCVVLFGGAASKVLVACGCGCGSLKAKAKQLRRRREQNGVTSACNYSGEDGVASKLMDD